MENRTYTSAHVLSEESAMVDQPDSISLPLKPHQLAALKRMVELDERCCLRFPNETIESNVGILGDLPGSGKTITMIALIAMMKGVEGSFFDNVTLHQHRNYGIISKEHKNNGESEYRSTTLIVAPPNIVKHWENHLRDYSHLAWDTVTESNMLEINTTLLDVVICASDVFNLFTRYTERGDASVVWNRVIIDEAHSISIPNTRYVTSRFIWLITSTYLQLANRRNNGFLKEMFRSKSYHNLVKHYYKNIIIESKTEFIRSSFLLSDPEFIEIQCRLSDGLRMIRNFVSATVVEKINAGDMDGAIIELGGSVETNNNIIDLITKNFKNRIVDLESQLLVIERLEMSELDRDRRRKELADRLKSANERRESLVSSIKKITETNCLICMDALQSPTMIGCCNNLFCAECLIEWMKIRGACPICRESINPTKLITVGEISQKIEKSQKKTKIDTVIDIVKQNPRDRFLVFSDHNGSFKDLKSRLSKENISNDCISYTSPQKTVNVLKKFREKQIDVILLNSLNNGAGLEIPEATGIILLHKLPSDLEMQLVGRANRPGRVGGLRVWRLRYENE